ncbi:hypothetical protein UlMin_045917 [Ulmus minor]
MSYFRLPRDIWHDVQSVCADFWWGFIWEVINPSFTWRSILWERELVEKGARWCVGHGDSVSIYNSKWLPKPHDFQVISPQVLHGDVKLACLLRDDGSWNNELIH